MGVAGDDEGAVVVVDDIVGEEGNGDRVGEGESVGIGVDGVKVDEAERGGGDGKVGVRGRESNAVGKGDTES